MGESMHMIPSSSSKHMFYEQNVSNPIRLLLSNYWLKLYSCQVEHVLHLHSYLILCFFWCLLSLPEFLFMKCFSPWILNTLPAKWLNIMQVLQLDSGWIVSQNSQIHVLLTIRWLSCIISVRYYYNSSVSYFNFGILHEFMSPWLSP